MAQVSKKSTAPKSTKPAVQAEPIKGSARYPTAATVLKLVASQPNGLGAQQVQYWQQLVTAAAKARKAKAQFNGAYIAANCPAGRRCLRRATRAGMFVGWGPQGPLSA